MQAVAKWVGAPSNCSEHIAEAGACRQRHVSKEPCVRVVGRSKVMHERIVMNSSRRLLSREACASCRQGPPAPCCACAVWRSEARTKEHPSQLPVTWHGVLAVGCEHLNPD